MRGCPFGGYFSSNSSTIPWAERTGNLTTVLLVLAGFAVVTLACALWFPDRAEELRPELWEQPDANINAGMAPVAAE